ncbi:MAG TPA: inositol monophosphatase [Casimicrobiaceae bacterium]|nr:inositol monophosphatase [Casimicrobiaceae bacterium]
MTVAATSDGARSGASRYREILSSAEAVAMQAAQTLLAMRDRKLDVSRKELRDVVTEADLASERLVIAGLRALTPDAAILSEEAGASGPEGGPRWIVDPLDGTVNYASGLAWFSVTMAYQEEGRTRVGVLHSPLGDVTSRFVEGEIATVNGREARVSSCASLSDAVVSVILTSHYDDAEVARAAEAIRRLGNRTRGVRIIVSGGLELSLIADSRLDGFVSLKADIVSHAAAMPLVRAAGGRVTRLDGRDSQDDDLQKIASNGLIHDELLACLHGL